MEVCRQQEHFGWSYRGHFQGMGYTRSVADPCLYVWWDEDGKLCIWLTWIDNCIVTGNENVVARESSKLMGFLTVRVLLVQWKSISGTKLRPVVKG
jgi:hypothetical protein